MKKIPGPRPDERRRGWKIRESVLREIQCKMPGFYKTIPMNQLEHVVMILCKMGYMEIEEELRV